MNHDESRALGQVEAKVDQALAKLNSIDNRLRALENLKHKAAGAAVVVSTAVTFGWKWLLGDHR